MKIFNGILLISFCFIVSCKKRELHVIKENINDTITISQVTSDYDSLRYKVKVKGDSDAYDELFYGLMDSNEAGRTDSVMYYSKIMAMKFKNEKAYFDYFEAFCEKNKLDVDYHDFSKIDLNGLDITTKKEAISWLTTMLEEKIITKKEFDIIKK